MKKYPRTLHFNFSPEIHSDDKVISLKYLGNFLQEDIVILEKIDGSNTCFKGLEGVFGRSHMIPTKEPWYDYIKGIYYSKLDFINPDYWYFGENTYAIHSIEYTNMVSYFYLFAIYDSKKDIWLSWDAVVEEAIRIGLSLVPVLFRGQFLTITEINDWMDTHIEKDSVLGGSTEGFVARVCKSFSGDLFSQYVAKYVRLGHVQTDEHWKKNWKKAALLCEQK